MSVNYIVKPGLKAGKEKTINIFIGTAMTEGEIKKCVTHCREEYFVAVLSLRTLAVLLRIIKTATDSKML